MKSIYVLSFAMMLIACKEKQEVDNIPQSGDATLDKMTALIYKDPSNANMLFQRAQYLYQKENYDQAVLDMAGAMRVDSTNIEYHHFLADIYMDSYQSDLALNTMARAVDLDPKRIGTLLKYAEFQLILKQYDASIKTINNLLSFDPQNAEGFFMLGMNFRELEESSKAINSFQTAVEIEPDLIDGWLMLGKIYEEQKDTRAFTFYENALLVDSLSIDALHSKAYFLQNHNHVSDAIKIYSKIIRLDSEYIPAYLNKGILFLEAEDYDRSWQEFNIICQIKSTYHLGFYYRGVVNEKQGKKQAAINDYQSCLNLKSDFARAQDALDNLKTKES